MGKVEGKGVFCRRNRSIWEDGGDTACLVAPDGIEVRRSVLPFCRSLSFCIFNFRNFSALSPSTGGSTSGEAIVSAVARYANASFCAIYK